jgi:hypothetical protein
MKAFQQNLVKLEGADTQVLELQDHLTFPRCS